jgi:MFS family permease
MLGPALGGFITTYASWHWIFLINIPIGLLGITLVSLFFENLRSDIREPFDLIGLVLIGCGVGGLAFGLTVTGINLVPASGTVALIAAGVTATFAYVVRSRGMAAPVIDLKLFRLATFRAGVVGGFVFRIGAGALPFLLPLLMQLGFGMTPFQSGLVTLSTAVGAMMMKSAVPRILRQIGFRNTLTWNALVASVMMTACAAFTASTPVAAMVAILLLGGFFRSLQFTSINTIAYAEIDPARMSRATSLVAVAQQLSQSVGVAVGALVVETVLRLRGHAVLNAADFPPAFIVVGLISASSVFMFATMPPDAGEDMAQRKTVKRREPAPAE